MNYNNLYVRCPSYDNSNVYSFSGSHCVGKTTLLEYLRSQLDYNCVVAPSNSTDIKTSSTLSRVDVQLALIEREKQTLQHLLSTSTKGTIILKDRSILDTLIYSQYFLQKHLIDYAAYTTIERATFEIFNYYKRMFIITTKDISYDATRSKYSMDESSRVEIDVLFKSFYYKYRDALPLTLIDTSNLEERVKIINSFLTSSTQ